MSTATSPAGRVEARFGEIAATTMRDLPLLHDGLTVRAVGFDRCDAGIVGVLVTPWCMNLLLFDHPVNGIVGEVRSVEFPSGSYDFIVAEDATLGTHLSCSLFSPMFEFEDQSAAEAVAAAVMTELLRAPADAPPSGVDRGRRAFLRATVAAETG
jgi:[NiFe] hydrogenase assembly HybE family chaperone